MAWCLADIKWSIFVGYYYIRCSRNTKGLTVKRSETETKQKHSTCSKAAEKRLGRYSWAGKGLDMI